MIALKPVMALIFTMIVWGVGPVFIRTVALDLGPGNALVIRYVIVTLVYLTGLFMLGSWRIAARDWPRLLIVSWIGMLGYNLGSTFGFAHVPAGIGGLIIGTQPLLIALLAALIARERLTPATILGLIVAFIGTGLLFWNDLAAAAEGSPLLRGGFLIFMSGVAWAVYVVLAKPLIQTYGAYPVSAISIGLATLPMLLMASGETVDVVKSMSWRDWGNMFYLAVISTLIATITWNFGASRLPSAAAAAFLYLVPVIAVIAGALMLDEKVSLNTLAGGALILLGVAIAQVGPRLRMGLLRD
ncbi:MAG: DMT family transporter [Rhizobiales bacterium]|nr:DMT family transporter [Hyphomicrobiales bacterium]